MKVLLVVLAVAAAAAAAAAASAVTPCGVVLDGPHARRDLDRQASASSIAASWRDFEDGRERNRVLRYEWAVISEGVISPEIKDGSCRDAAGFSGVPDVRDWEAIGTRTQATAGGLKLQEGVTYFVVVRATTSLGRQVYANSDGVTVDTSAVQPPAAVRKQRSVEAAEAAEATRDHATGGECAIDSANRCRESRKTVGEFLEELYGPPEFNRRSQTINLVRTVPPELIESSPSSSGGGGAGIHAGALVGIFLGVVGLCLCGVLVLTLVTGVSSKSNKFKTNINRSDNLDEF